MAVLLAAASVALSVLVARNLDRAIDAGLSARAGDATALIEGRGGTGRLDESGEAIAQVLGPTAACSHDDAGRRRALLTPEERLAASNTVDGIIVDRRGSRPARTRSGSSRGPCRRWPGPRVLVIGESLAQREQSLESLHTLLVVGGPFALLLASLVGYGLAAFALRPVERCAGAPRRSPPARPAGACRAVADDEIGRLGRTLNEMLDRLDAAFKRERAFVADASHELRTPLASCARSSSWPCAARATATSSGRRALGGGGDRPAVGARRGPAGDRARRPGRAADPPGALHADDLLERSRGASRRAREPGAAARSPSPRRAIRLAGDPRAAGAGARQHGRQRAALRPRAITADAPSAATAASACTCATTAPGFPPDFLPTRLRALHARGRGALARRHRARPGHHRRDREAHGGAAHAANRRDGRRRRVAGAPDGLSSPHDVVDPPGVMNDPAIP